MDLFKTKHIERTYKIKLNGTIKEVFILFTPIEEKKWAEGWNPEIIFPENEEIIKGTVFKSYNKEDGYTYWVIADYEHESYYIRYINFLQGIRNGILEIRCSKTTEGETEAEIKYIITGISEKGNNFINSFTEKYFIEYISDWKKSINSYLETKDK